MRIAGSLSGDKVLHKLYKNKLDLHSMNARGAFSLEVPTQEIAEEMIRNGWTMDQEGWEVELLRRELKYIKETYPDKRDQGKSVA